jgi:hypothetical protein
MERQESTPGALDYWESPFNLTGFSLDFPDQGVSVRFPR